jgi:Uma2 family endonuclease
MRDLTPSWSLDPNDPRAPSEEVWESLTPEERLWVVDSLPSEIESALPPEGDVHRLAAHGPMGALGEFFRRIRRRVYLSSNLLVYYPNERVFAPDLIAVLDVDPHLRDRWVVSHEGKGLDLALEVMYRGDDRKDLERNVEWYARLGIPEYFLFDRKRMTLRGWALPRPDARRYEPLLPQAGRWPSRVLGLELGLEGDRLRFFFGTAPVPELEELARRAENLLAEAERRFQEETERAEQEAQRAEQEAQRAEQEAERARELERQLAKLVARVAELEAGAGRKDGS